MYYIRGRVGKGLWRIGRFCIRLGAIDVVGGIRRWSHGGALMTVPGHCHGKFDCFKRITVEGWGERDQTRQCDQTRLWEHA
jgi:hypothetical protein